MSQEELMRSIMGFENFEEEVEAELQPWNNISSTEYDVIWNKFNLYIG